jgi:hypothetical protein
VDCSHEIVGPEGNHRGEMDESVGSITGISSFNVSGDGGIANVSGLQVHAPTHGFTPDSTSVFNTRRLAASHSPIVLHA